MKCPTYAELKSAKHIGEKFTYQELLSTDEWKNIREKIILRDKKVCRECKESETYYESSIGDFWLREEHHHDIALLKIGDDIAEEKADWINYFHEKVDKKYVLHVHHTYYVINKLPWEYPESSLITLCNWCHLKFHTENKVDIFNDDTLINKVTYGVCKRCHGTGWFPEYKHVINGICFECNGARFTIDLHNI